MELPLKCLSDILALFRLELIVMCISSGPTGDDLNMSKSLEHSDAGVQIVYAEDLANFTIPDKTLVLGMVPPATMMPGPSSVWLLPIGSMPSINVSQLRLDSMVLLYEESQDIEGFSIEEMYGTKGSETPFLSHFGNCTPGWGLAVEEPSIWERRSNLGGLQLVNTQQPWFPLTIMTEDGYTGFTVDLLKFLMSRLNFSVVDVDPPDGAWGSLVEVDGGGEAWNGMVGMLVRGEADICTAALTINEQRAKVSL